MSSSTSSSNRHDARHFVVRLTIFSLTLIPLYAVAYLLSVSGKFDGTYITTQSYKLAQMRGPINYDVIIMGDSCAMAIDPTDPETLHQLQGQTIYNFGLVNLGGMYPVYSTLKKYMDAGKSPKMILLSFLPSLLTRQPDIFDGSKFTKFYAAKFYTLHELLGDGEIRSHPGALTHLLAEKFKLRFIQDRYDIPFNQKMFERVKAKSGQMLILEDTRATEGEVQSAPQFRSEFQPSAQAMNYLSKFLQLAETHGAQVIIFMMPEPPTAYQARLASGYFSNYFEALHELALQHPNLSIIERPFSLPNECFSTDVTHLNREGVERYQKELWPVVLERARTLLAERDRKAPKKTDDALAETSKDSLHSGAVP
ncbi:MAG: hypothetical protein ACJ74G_08260 [Blastocatellia bacterium]